MTKETSHGVSKAGFRLASDFWENPEAALSFAARDGRKEPLKILGMVIRFKN